MNPSNPTVADRNFNPGNLKNPSTGSFHQFSSEGEGYAALMNDLQSKVNGTSKTGLNGDSTLYDFSSTYAPSSDNNDPSQYTVNLANRLGVRPDTKLSELKNRIPDFAQAVASNEGYSGAKGFKAKPQPQQQQQDNKGYVNNATIVPSTPQAPDNRSMYDKFLDTADAGNWAEKTLNFTGGNKVANLFGTLGAHYGDKIKGALGGEDNSKYIPASADDIDPLGTALDAGKLGLTLATLGSIKNLGNKFLPSALNPTIGGSSSLNPAVGEVVKTVTGQGINASSNALGQYNAIGEALKNPELLPTQRLLLENAYRDLAPQALALQGGNVPFSALHPTISKVPGLLYKLGIGGLGLAGLSKVANQGLLPK